MRQRHHEAGKKSPNGYATGEIEEELGISALCWGDSG
jgi:hypothetical protein